MDEKTKNSFAKLILQQIEKLESDIESLKELTKPISPDNSIGRVSRMEAIGEKSINDSNLRKAKLRLQQLKKASERIKGDDFGYCLNCEEPIQIKRLEILPESTICMSCLKGNNKKE